MEVWPGIARFLTLDLAATLILLGTGLGGLADRIEAVAIVTPNHLHYPIAKAFLRRGIHVICDKPLTATLGLLDRGRSVAASSSSGRRCGTPSIRMSRSRRCAPIWPGRACRSGNST